MMNAAADDYDALMEILGLAVTTYMTSNPDCNTGLAAQALRDLADALAGDHGH